MQGKWVWFLCQEDSTCLGATKTLSHKYWAHESQILKSVYARAHALQQEYPMRSSHTKMKRSSCSLQLEKGYVQQQRPTTAKNKINK